MLHTVYLSLGSNIGDRRRTIDDAIDMIGDTVGTVVRRSSLVETEPWGFRSPNMFLNVAVCVRTAMSPFELLRATQDIEKRLGRMLKSTDGIYHDRSIDIDILLYDDLEIDTPELTIPHPLMYGRDFVMTPLREIMSDERSQ